MNLSDCLLGMGLCKRLLGCVYVCSIEVVVYSIVYVYLMR